MKVFSWLLVLSLLGSCARKEPAPSGHAVAAPVEPAPSADAPAPSTPDPSAASRQDREVGGARSFEPVAAGLSVLTSERVDSDGEAHDWTVVRIDLKAHRLRVRVRGEAPFADLREAPDVLVAVNGGFFDPDLGASGLLISEGVVLARERPGGGSGLLVIARGVARLLKRGARRPAEAEFAVQCGPRLIEPGGAIGIRSDDGQRAARTAACVRDSGRELDLIVATSTAHLGGGPGLLQLARWLAEPLAPGEASGCEAALNLDGGPSTGVVVAGAPEVFREPLGPVPFAVVVPRLATPRAD
ncbi:MAG TPA: phosphodiester glycosidase family protein [Polyangiaceae bacterium]|nr:phosphodiester glycosidase family protein [Polyangiaceae bacterium]